MDGLGNFGKDYLGNMAKRAKVSKVYTPFQAIGVELADILGDRAHTPLYIRIAKTHPDHQSLMSLAKDISTREGVANRGAYFMKMLFKKEDFKGNGTQNTRHNG